MGQVRAYLFSFLAMQLIVGGDSFEVQFPNAWLVWEPGVWHAPTLDATLPTPGPVDPTRTYPGDALCFELSAPQGAPIRLGRAPECELVINDATISRTHLVLERGEGGAYTAAVAPGGRGATLDGVALSESPLPLRSGGELRVGAVTLTFHDRADFARRLLEQQLGRR